VAINFDDVVRQLTAAGIILRDGRLEVGTHKPVRCLVDGGGREKRGWYRLYETRLPMGDDVIVGSFGVWQGNDNGATKIELGRHELTPEQRDAIKKRLADDRKAAELDRKRAAEEAARQAQRLWERARPDGDTSYLKRKQIQAFGIRFTGAGEFVVPMMDTAGVVHGLQFIRSAESKRTYSNGEARPSKEFWPAGLIKKGRFHLIGVPSTVLLVAEGYATAATLHQATGLPVAVAFDAGNLQPVCLELGKRFKATKLLICADDDAYAKCPAAGCAHRFVLAQAPTNCPACGTLHNRTNTGIVAASAVALEVNGAWVAPQFIDVESRDAAFLQRGEKLTDFNDLAAATGALAVSSQIAARLAMLGWKTEPSGADTTTTGQGGGVLRPIASVGALLKRYALVYGMGGTVFDRDEHRLLPLSDMRDACLTRELHRAWSEHPGRTIVREREVGFDPAETDRAITCNLWGGWPTTPKPGRCERLLELLRYMCSADRDPESLFRWVLKWLAYPLQHPGAKMKTTIVVHGPQGTGKNMFFDTYQEIFGLYGGVIDQTAIEDKFNDWASRKLFLIADEIVARSELHHVKNRLKAFITGKRILINPKGMRGYEEANHVNLVFLSNEVMPVVVEEDDRRHCVIWTPPKWPRERYLEVKAEIDNGGGAALHDYLLRVELGEFDEGSMPPMTTAKADLIDLSRDSTSRFYFALEAGDIEGLKARPALTVDVFEAYRIWCNRTNNKAAPQQKLVAALRRHHGVEASRQRYLLPGADPTKDPAQHGMLMLGEAATPPGIDRRYWLGDQITLFRAALDEYRDIGSNAGARSNRVSA
jgi:putative DNA primase/helicase